MSSADPDLENTKVPLAAFLKHLTNGSAPMSKAMAVAGKIYKTHATPAQLKSLNDSTLKDLGIPDASDRKLILSALRKAGFKAVKGRSLKRGRDEELSQEAHPSSSTSSPQSLPAQYGSPERVTALDAIITPPKRKRARVSNELLPDGPSDEELTPGDLEFNEVLTPKHAVINRAPVMTAWSMIVAERLNFKRDEALSIASVYTEMNAISKGVTLGIYGAEKKAGMEVWRGGTQPYVELMGRSPLYQTQEGQWRALSNGSPVPPTAAFTYICRSFRQTTPFIIGALKLLAETYSSEELNRRGYSLYCDFRPDAEQWGKRADLSCAKIMSLRKEGPIGGFSTAPPAISLESATPVNTDLGAPRQLSLEEYEAALDEDHTFDNVQL